MSEEEKIERAKMIAQKRRYKTSEDVQNNRQRKKMSFWSKISIQILASICIFGGFYFLSDNYSMAIEKIKPVFLYDMNLEDLYGKIDNTIKRISDLDKEKSVETNSEENKGEEGNAINEVNPQNEIQENGIGGGDEEVKESETIDDVSYIKANISFAKPVEGVVTSRYGQREPTDIISANHTGIDIGVPEGTPILSAMDGIVETVSEEGGYGKHIKISNGEISTLYAHCSNIVVEQGTNVVKGQKIAEAGQTGNATGPHLHFEIRRNNVAVNPQDVFEL